MEENNPFQGVNDSQGFLKRRELLLLGRICRAEKGKVHGREPLQQILKA